MSTFPDTLTDKELVLEQAKYAWKLNKRQSGQKLDTRLKSVKIKREEKEITHTYTFVDGDVPPQLAGFFSSAIEEVVNRKIIDFTPGDTEITIKFSAEKLDPERQDDDFGEEDE
jgi:50S ribosomal subunit-associated GTPase HflX